MKILPPAKIKPSFSTFLFAQKDPYNQPFPVSFLPLQEI